jgi:thiol-disulfide isomerase/thioredoxin
MKISLSLFIVAFMFAAGCSKNPEKQSSAQLPATEHSSPAKISAPNVSKVISVEKNEGRKAADFSWTDENGNKVTFAEFSKDNVVLINFWATWCGPCKRELPDLIALHNEYKGKNVKIIGISVDRDADVLGLVRNFAAEANLTYPIVIDNGDLEKAFGGIRGIPTSFFVNKNGEIVKKMIGVQSKETFQAALTAAAQ